MKKNRLLVYIIATQIVNNCFGQSPLVKQWDYRFGGFRGEWFGFFQQTADGGYILGGTSFSEIGGDKTQPSWDTASCLYCKQDYWIIKIDSVGNKEWEKRFGGISSDRLTCLQQTTDGGYILGGYS